MSSASTAASRLSTPSIVTNKTTLVRTKGGVLPKDMAEAIQTAIAKVEATYPDLLIRFGTIIPEWTWAKNARDRHELEAHVAAEEAEIAHLVAEEAKRLRLAAKEEERL
ncbi:uncharacterized protein FIBRA_09450 [Fibroporia radiculosa]|uniref:Uncharacterized protein n=1 Tax=Fibroporia radiculosa TaxID=599839 RepID=J7SCF0_9APHY|nr:uncharacterized protein FIBRA_09450 [Fibroporia radiculosa]CCM07116.1 predicted protein [Fibroporia radiculosa]